MTVVQSNNGFPNYASVAELKTIDLALNTKVRTVSYYSGWAAASREPVGGTTYNIVSLAEFTAITGESSPDEVGDHTLVNGNIAMIDKRAIKNVLEFGAYSDGTTDDVTNIRAALASASFDGGGHVHFPGGTYRLIPDKDNYLWADTTTARKNYAILLIDSNIKVTGDGPSTVLVQSTTLDSDGTPTDGRGNYATITTFANSNAAGKPKTLVNTNIEVVDIMFDGNNVYESGIGVTYVGVSNFRVAECYFKDTQYECSYFAYCRGGEFTNNLTDRCGIEGAFAYGGGVFVDWCVNVQVHYNTFSDSGYYGIRMENSFECILKNNGVRHSGYTYSAGRYGIYGKNNANCKYLNNMVESSAWSGIRDFRGFNNLVHANSVLDCGVGGTGNNIHGFLIDDEADTGFGRIGITDNISVYSEGAGFFIPGAKLDGETTTYNAGNIISNNIAVYNRQDGIVVYGDNHKITGNIVESNSHWNSGIYSGIVLVGSKYCIVDTNTCQDLVQPAVRSFNLDAFIGEAEQLLTPIYIAHYSQTQRYGIEEIKNGAIISNYNVITNNNLMNNGANPGIVTPQSGGFNAATGCGANDIKANNLGQ